MAAVILAVFALSYQGIKYQQKKHTEKKRLEQEALDNAPPPPYGADDKELIKHHGQHESLRQKATRKLSRGKRNSVAESPLGESSAGQRRGSEVTLVDDDESDYENGRRGSSLDKERAAI
ncbi:hypothetical protein LIA77_06086 [Sarocladium implicatum]|nr:hypothetical protein LIA77_06086 [Sarocladium implicatum]